MSFGSYLKKQRESNNWTIKELAERLGFSSSYISQLENGARIPSQKQLAIFAKAYQLPEEEVRKQWTEGKIQQVSKDGNYKFGITDAGDKRVHEVANKLEEGLEELKKSFSGDGHFKLPVLVAIPIDDLDGHLSRTSDFVLLPKDNVIPGHRVFGLRVSDLTLPDAGILSGDFIILDADIPAKNGDIVIMSTPDGLVMSYYQERGDHLELRPERDGFKKTYHLQESKMIGRLVYHIKKY
ncbi:helix-turn-helix domain-containing protein [Candidatus Parcubacteria bacterium]|nr:MAG: helix-turn-helix domain-containing protein [Candidatus Parcubacteria bacterium]